MSFKAPNSLFAAVIAIGVSCITTSMGWASEQEEEAKATLVMVMLLKKCAIEVPDSMYPYAERQARLAWPRDWKNQTVEKMKFANDSFNATSASEQNNVCSSMSKVAKNWK